MNNHTKARRCFLTSVAAAAFLAASAVRAQPSRPVRTLTEPAYRELRRLAQELDARAQHAADRTAHDRYRIYRRDNTFLREASDFAARAGRFNARIARYRAEPWPVQEEIGALLTDAGEIQGRVRQSRWIDDHISSDWNEIVEIVHRMARVGDGRGDFGARPGPGDLGPPQRVEERDPRGSPPNSDHRRDEYGSPNPSGAGDPRGDRLAGLARELEDRAVRAVQSAERVVAGGAPYRREFLQVIRDFKSQAGAFGQAIRSDTLNPGQIRAEASRLLDIVRQNDQRMRQGNAFREAWPDWQGAMQTLQRMIDLPR